MSQGKVKVVLEYIWLDGAHNFRSKSMYFRSNW